MIHFIEPNNSSHYNNTRDWIKEFNEYIYDIKSFNPGRHTPNLSKQWHWEMGK
jgi:hypothetical protein